jgi:drug/metabolite transporter (DMT)-like permease
MRSSGKPKSRRWRAAVGGVLLLGEVLSLRLVLAASLILGGVALAVTASRR